MSKGQSHEVFLPSYHTHHFINLHFFETQNAFDTDAYEQSTKQFF